MDYATMQSILGWAAIAAALIAGGIVGVMLVYDLGKPLWSRLARLWRRSPVECVAAVALLCYCVAWGGGKITFPRTNAEYELLKDNGSYVADDWGWIAFTPHPILPKTADIQLWRRNASSTNDADWVLHYETNLGTSYGFDFYITNASNYNYMVFTTWQPAPAVQTNGVLHVDWVVATNAETAAEATHALAAVPLKSSVAVDGAEAWPNADFDPTPVTARSYVQDGLVAMWDGIENAGWGVHDPNATNWVDLVGGYCAYVNGSARNTLPFRSSSTPQGIESWGTMAWDATALLCEHSPTGTRWSDSLPFSIEKNGENAALFSAFSSNATVEVCFRHWDFSTNDPYYSEMDIGRIWIALGWRNISYGRFYDSPFFTTQGVGPYISTGEDKRLYTVTHAIAGPTLSPYKNGVLDPSGSKSVTWRNPIKSFLSLASMQSRKQWSYCTRIYNRALTPAEIAHNAEIDRRRFGTAADADK